ncbi:hypothetical protein [Streptomyces sp. B5E4]|uniref:hypothetical protein n=1 Tax=Streptomyces sp. B5E4 TaxID=3153568 RepID=UPI00325D8C8C
MIDCPGCGRWHDAGGAPRCAAAAPAPDAPVGGGPVPLQEPGPAVPGPDPRDLELFAEGRAASAGTAPYAPVSPDDGTLEHPVVPGRARHGRGRRRRPPRARVAALAAAGVAAISGGLVAANVLGGDGRPDADRADERPDAPFGPLPTNSSGTPDAPGTPSATSPPAERAGAPDRAQRNRPPAGPPSAASADPTTPGPSPSGSSTQPAGPSSTASSEATVSAPSGTPSGSQSSSPSHTPTPTPTDSGGEESEEERGRPDRPGGWWHPNG